MEKSTYTVDVAYWILPLIVHKTLILLIKIDELNEIIPIF